MPIINILYILMHNVNKLLIYFIFYYYMIYEEPDQDKRKNWKTQQAISITNDYINITNCVIYNLIIAK